jgi:hypothetical protein
MRKVLETEKAKLMFKLFLLVLLGLAAVVSLPLTSQQPLRTQCVPELTARQIAEETSLPEYPEETEASSTKGVVFAAVLFGTDGKLSKIKFYDTPNSQASDAVKKALEKWRLKKIFGGGQEPTMTRTAIRFILFSKTAKVASKSRRTRSRTSLVENGASGFAELLSTNSRVPRKQQILPT